MERKFPEKRHYVWHAMRVQHEHDREGGKMVSAELCVMCVKVIKAFCQFH